MSVLIKGMEMPEPGAYLIRLYVREDGGADIWGVGTYIPKEPLPAVPVPPHGDLIDRDWTLKHIRPWSPEDEYAACTFDTVKKLMHTLLNDSPTIIPAEEATTQDTNVPTTYDLLYEEGGPDTR